MIVFVSRPMAAVIGFMVEPGSIGEFGPVGQRLIGPLIWTTRLETNPE